MVVAWVIGYLLVGMFGAGWMWSASSKSRHPGLVSTVIVWLWPGVLALMVGMMLDEWLESQK